MSWRWIVTAACTRARSSPACGRAAAVATKAAPITVYGAWTVRAADRVGGGARTKGSTVQGRRIVALARARFCARAARAADGACKDVGTARRDVALHTLIVVTCCSQLRGIGRRQVIAETCGLETAVERDQTSNRRA